VNGKQRLVRYSTAVGSLAFVGTAAGAVQDIPEQIVEGEPEGFAFEQIDLNGDGVENYTVHISNSSYGYSYLAITGQPTGNTDFPYNQIARFYDGGTYLAEQFDEGDLIDGSLDFSSGFTFIWNESFPLFEDFLEQRGFIGLRFDIPGESPHFACVEITVDDVTGNNARDLHILGGVFEDESDVPVECRGEAPPTVEPLAVPVNGLVFWLTALLAGGVMLYTGRRRRKQAA